METKLRSFDAIKAEIDKKKKAPEGGVTRDGIKSRRAVVAYLLAMPGSTNGEIAKHLTMKSGQVSQIVQPLVRLGILKVPDGTRKGQHGVQYYFFNHPMMHTEKRDVDRRATTALPVAAPPIDHEWMTIKEFCDRFGYSRNYIHSQRLLSTNTIKHKRVAVGGRRKYILLDRESVEQWAATHKPNAKRKARIKKLRRAQPAKKSFLNRLFG